jgi:hypothetical protein
MRLSTHKYPAQAVVRPVPAVGHLVGQEQREDGVVVQVTAVHLAVHRLVSTGRIRVRRTDEAVGSELHHRGRQTRWTGLTDLPRRRRAAWVRNVRHIPPSASRRRGRGLTSVGPFR